jgi:hypothetical protein
MSPIGMMKVMRMKASSGVTSRKAVMRRRDRPASGWP